MHEQLQETCRALEHLGELGQAFARAIEAGDGELAQSIVGESRKTRSQVARAQSELGTAIAQQGNAELDMDRLTRAVSTAELGGQYLSAWFQRSLPSEDVLLTSAQGRRVLADRLLGPIWDVDSDVIVLLGHSPGLAQAFVELGQRRVLVVAVGAMPGYPAAADVVGQSEKEISQAIAGYQRNKPARVQVFCVDPTLDENSHQTLQRYVSIQFQHHVTHWNTIERHGLAMCRNLITNLPQITKLPAIDALRGIARGRTAVVVSPGPSLDRNIEHLRQFKDKAVIVAVSHALGALSRHNIVPDVVVACDMEDLSYHFDVPEVGEVGAVVLSAACHSSTFSMALPRVFTAAFQMPIETWLSRTLPNGATTTVGGSVAHAALRVCEIMGATRIALVGQDLSFPDGRVYADGHDGATAIDLSKDGRRMVMSGWSTEYSSMESVSGAQRSDELDVVMVPGYDGGEVPTSPILAVFLQWFEAVAGTVDAELVNATEGGAAIKGFAPMPLLDLLASCENPQPIHSALDVAWRGGDRPMGLRRVVQDACTQLRRMKRLASDTTPAADKKARRRRARELWNLHRKNSFLQMHYPAEGNELGSIVEFCEAILVCFSEVLKNPVWSEEQ